MRPDLLGSVTAYFGDGEFAEVVYFTSEEEAREAEQRPIPDEFADRMAEWEAVVRVERYLDLREPWLIDA